MSILVGRSGTGSEQKITVITSWYPASGQGDLDVVRDLLEEAVAGRERAEGLALSVIHDVLIDEALVYPGRSTEEVLAEAKRVHKLACEHPLGVVVQ